MKKLIFTVLALALTASPALAKGNGHGHGNGNASAHRDDDDHGRRADRDRVRDGDRDHDRDDHGRGRAEHDRRAPIFGIHAASNTPPGWSKGKKTGWGNCDVPPGQVKKVGCHPNHRVVVTRRPTSPNRYPRGGVSRDGQVIASANPDRPQQPTREFNDPRHLTKK